MIKCPECGVVNLDASKPCSGSGLDLMGALRYMPDKDKQKLYVKGPPPTQRIILNPQPVTIKDFDMPFGSMILFMFKWGLAAIPAIIMLAALVGGVIVAMGQLLTEIFG